MMPVVGEMKGRRSGACNEENRSEEMLTGLGLDFNLHLPRFRLPYHTTAYLPPPQQSTTTTATISFPKASNYVTTIQHPSTQLQSPSNHIRERKPPITLPSIRPSNPVP